jgi:hypothetical protein
LWDLIINWSFSTNSEETEKILIKGSQTMFIEVSSLVRQKYLDWSLRSDPLQGLNKVRNVYKKLRDFPPYDLEFIMKYIEIEKSSPNLDDKRISGAYEDALLHFGKQNIGKKNQILLTFFEFNTIFFVFLSTQIYGCLLLSTNLI